MVLKTFMAALIMTCLGGAAFAHEHNLPPAKSQAQYIANEAILITDGETKIMFDPFFASGFGTYPEVPAATKIAMMEQDAPFDGIDAIFVSHVHGDHFDGKQVLAYMKRNTAVELFLPEQGARYMRELAGEDESMKSRFVSVKLEEGDAPLTLDKLGLKIDAVRIPHSGWPRSRRDVNNLVFRVTLPNGATVAHMGDADVRRQHFIPYKEHWAAKRIDTAFPPYWFLTSRQGRNILEDDMNVAKSIGIHVPIKVPADLKVSGQDYFSKSGETREIGE